MRLSSSKSRASKLNIKYAILLLMNNQGNKLLATYHNGKKVATFQNNPLVNKGSINGSYQKIKDMNQVTHIEKVNELEKKYGLNKIKEIIIEPKKVILTKDETIEFEKKYDYQKNNYTNQVQNYWKSRTNEPYKGILKGENYQKHFKDREDLVVYRITAADKNAKAVENDFEIVNQNIKKHDHELKLIYSNSNKVEHKKKFEYNHVYKFRVKMDPKGHEELRNDQEKLQNELEEENKKKDGILSLVQQGIFDMDEVKDIVTSTKSTPVSKREIYLQKHN